MILIVHALQSQIPIQLTRYNCPKDINTAQNNKRKDYLGILFRPHNKQPLQFCIEFRSALASLFIVGTTTSTLQNNHHELYLLGKKILLGPHL